MKASTLHSLFLYTLLSAAGVPDCLTARRQLLATSLPSHTVPGVTSFRSGALEPFIFPPISLDFLFRLFSIPPQKRTWNTQFLFLKVRWHSISIIHRVFKVSRPDERLCSEVWNEQATCTKGNLNIKQRGLMLCARKSCPRALDQKEDSLKGFHLVPLARVI